MARTTWISPTLERTTSWPCRAATSSTARLDDRLVPTGPGVLPSTKSAATTWVSSSPKKRPPSSTNASRSASGSTTMPRSAPVSATRSVSPAMWAGSGSGLWANRPVTSPLRTSTSVTPRAPSIAGTATAPTELMPSTTTRNPRWRMVSGSMYGSSRIFWMWYGRRSAVR